MKLSLLVFFILLNSIFYSQVIKDEYKEVLLKSGDRIYSKALTKNKNLSSRELFYASLVYLSFEKETDRIDYLIDIADTMQDKDKNSRTYGNFKWYLSETIIKDYNANEFCMQAGLIIWIKYKDRLSASSKTKLFNMIVSSADFSMRRYVKESYTNIALMNVENLILAGEILNNKEILNEGYSRLKNIIFYLYNYGIHEYVSPTYYGVDLDCLGILYAFTKNSEIKLLTKKLIDLFWLDIIVNFHETSQKLSGTTSRTYDYLRNLGYLDKYLYHYGFLKEKPGLNESYVFFNFIDITPSSQLLTFNTYPRLIKEHWGIKKDEARTNYLLHDIALSTSSSTYHTMDVPLSIDIKGDRASTRFYFIPDGRDDPYGKTKIQESAHMKALHLTPFWTAVQEKGEALALVVYREKDLPKDFKTLKSHIVMPLDFDFVWINNRELKVNKNDKFDFKLKVNDSLLFRKENVFYGVKVILAKDFDDGNCPISFLYDKNKYNAARLTVDHYKQDKGNYKPNAAFFVKIGTELEKDFNSFKKEFIEAKAQINYKNSSIDIKMKTHDSLLEISAKKPFYSSSYLNPKPVNSVLEINGHDKGRELLADISFLKDFTMQYTNVIELGNDLYIEAEDGMILYPMIISNDKNASNNKYVWMPGKVQSIGNSDIGSISFKLKNKKGQKYAIWAKILTPAKEDDSFFLNIFTDNEVLIDNDEWHTGIHLNWEWVRINLKNTGKTFFEFPEGDIYLEFKAREDGAKIDKIFITTDIINSLKN
ncbi:MAG: hypothetical protein JXB50_01350 [Spirochaetes bacterium]|nr:hypothetical protein [Spirochaetota bacterium]